MPELAEPGLRGATEQKLHFSKPLQKSQFLQRLGRHRFGWAFLVAKVSRKSPNFCDKFCNRNKLINPRDYGVRRVLCYHPSPKCSFCWLLPGAQLELPSASNRQATGQIPPPKDKI